MANVSVAYHALKSTCHANGVSVPAYFNDEIFRLYVFRIHHHELYYLWLAVKQQV